MERDIKRAKGADEQPVATRKESILADPRFDQLEEEIRSKDALIAKLTKDVRYNTHSRALAFIFRWCSFAGGSGKDRPSLEPRLRALPPSSLLALLSQSTEQPIQGCVERSHARTHSTFRPPPSSPLVPSTRPL